MRKIIIYSVSLLLVSGFFFLVGISVKNLTLPNQVNNKDYLTSLISKYNPARATVQLVYKGELKNISDNQIVLTNDKGKEQTIIINSQMKQIMSYKTIVNNQSALQADRNDFTPGSKIIVILNADWINNKIVDFVLESDLRK